MDFLDFIPQEYLRPYIHPLVLNSFRRTSYLSRALRSGSRLTAYVFNLLQYLFESSPSDLVSIVLLLVILYVSLRVFGMVMSYVWSWVAMFGRLILLASLVYFAVWAYKVGAGEAVGEVGDWVSVLWDAVGAEDILNGGATGRRRGGSRRRTSGRDYTRRNARTGWR